MFNHILFPTDGSDHSEKALHFVKDFAQKYKSRVTVLHVYDIIGDTDLFNLGGHMADYMTELEKLVREKSQKILDHSKVLLEEYQIETDTLLLKGNPKHEIPRIAEAKECDMILLGSRGMGTLKGILIGSVSNYVVHHSECPVLLIR